MRADTADYQALFLAGVPLLDTRAPVEFVRGSVPGAINLPLMNDSERAAVGTCYKKSGQKAAIALGHQLVSGDIKAERVAAWLQFTRANPAGYLFCFRGGLRSQICQQWLREAGCDYPRVTGGYKAMRRFLLQTLTTVSQQRPLLILAGRTGCAKTALLQTVPAALDLEALAHHRGSAFGKRVGGQPTQIDFENALALSMLKTTTAHPQQALVVEDESKLVGRTLLPLPLQSAMQLAPIIVLEASTEARIEHSFQHYILGNLKDWQSTLGEAAGFDTFAQELRQSLRGIRRRLGDERFHTINILLEQALVNHAEGNNEQHRQWIGTLLTQYYDPLYDYQLAKRAHQVVFRGDAKAIREFIAQYQA